MASKEENIKIFNHTQELISKDKTLQDSIKYSIENSEFLADDMTIDIFCEKKTPGIVKVTKSSSFDAARKYTGKVAVLNFASATNPGGGVTKGSNAQEECLCRCSTLYNVLSNPKFDKIFYKPHKEHGNALHNNDAIYTPNIQIIKSDNYNLLYRPFSVNVITCAAPNLRETPANAYNHERGEKPNVTDEELFNIHFRRAVHIFTLAASHGDETIILGAFGCGAFKNPPEIVANAYKKAMGLGKLYFKNIEFAVYCGKDDTNYKVFKEILE